MKRRAPDTSARHTRTDAASSEDTKRYRFQSFSDRIDAVSLASIQKIGGYHGSGPDSTDSTWFELSLYAWQELNCTAPFARLCSVLRPLVGTLPRLLFHQQVIVTELFDMLQEASSDANSSARLALVPTLSLTAMLAKDLGPDFAPHFPLFFARLVPLLGSTLEPEMIEAVFASLLYVFKCILPQLLADLAGTFVTVAEALLAKHAGVSTRQNVRLRQLAAQCLGYLVRKCHGSVVARELFPAFDALASRHPAILVSEFAADTFVAAIHDDAGGRLGPALKPLLLALATHLNASGNGDDGDSVIPDVLRLTVVKLLMVTDSDVIEPLWKTLVQLLALDGATGPSSALQAALLATLRDAVAYRRGGRVRQHAALLERLPVLIRAEQSLAGIELVAHLLRGMDLEATLRNRPALVAVLDAVVANQPLRLIQLCRFLTQLQWRHYELVLADLATNLVTVAAAAVAAGHAPDELLLLAETVLGGFWTSDGSGPAALVPALGSLAVSADASHAIRSRNLLLAHFPTQIPATLNAQSVSEFVAAIDAEDRDWPRLHTSLAVVERLLLQSASAVCDLAIQEGGAIVQETALPRLLTPLLRPEQLRAGTLAIRALRLTPSASTTATLVAIANRGLCSSEAEWREGALELLGAVFETDASSLALVHLLRDIEAVPVDLEHYRDKIMQLKRLDHLSLLAISDREKRDADVIGTQLHMQTRIVLHYLLGFLQIRLSLLQGEGNRVTGRYATAFPSVFCAVMTELLRDLKQCLQSPPSSLGSVEGETTAPAPQYDIDTDDVALRTLASVRSAVMATDGIETTAVATASPLLNGTLLLSAVLKLFVEHPQETLARAIELREDVFLPWVLDFFAGLTASRSEQRALHGHLATILQILASIKLVPTRGTFSPQVLEDALLRLLAHGDGHVQHRALTCLLTLDKYEEVGGSGGWGTRLASLLDDARFRDELATLTSETVSLVQLPEWRPTVAPLLMRILFGRLVSRRGAARNRNSLRRRMIMGFFGAWDTASLTLVVDFVLEPFAGAAVVSPSRQIGFLGMLEDVFKSLGCKLDVAAIDRLAERLVAILLAHCGGDCTVAEGDDEDEEEDRDDSSLIPSVEDERRIRQLAMARLVDLFALLGAECLTRLRHLLTPVFTQVLNPRIAHLATQFTHSASSALLDLIVGWAQLPGESLCDVLLELSPSLWTSVLAALATPSAKTPVVAKLFVVVEEVLVRGGECAGELVSRVILPRLSELLDALDGRIRGSRDGLVIARVVAIVRSLAPYVSASLETARLAISLEGLLQLPSRILAEETLAELLLALAALMQPPLPGTAPICNTSLFSTAAALLATLKTRAARDAVCRLFSTWARFDSQLESLATTLADLHAWLPGRLEEADFDRRLAAFSRLRRAGEEAGQSASVASHLPVMHAMLFFLQDEDELSLRNQAFAVLKAFILRAQQEGFVTAVEPVETVETVEIDDADIETESEAEQELSAPVMSTIKSASKTPASLFDLVLTVLFPAVRRGLAARSETTRVEFIALLEVLVQTFPTTAPFSALQPLVAIANVRGDADKKGNNNDDQSAINNSDTCILHRICHVQESQRANAVREIGRLAGDEGPFADASRAVLEKILLPLVLHLALPDATVAPTAVSTNTHQDAIVTTGRLYSRLTWRPFLRQLQHFVRQIASGRRDETWTGAVLRLLPVMISFFSASSVSADDWPLFATQVHTTVLPAMFQLLHRTESGASRGGSQQRPATATKEDGGVRHVLRIPVAVSIGQLLRLVSAGSLDAPAVVEYFPRLVAVLLQTLQRREAEVRDVARGALVKIVGTLGPAFLPFVLREGGAVLTRGFQRHVLAFTVHALLVELVRRRPETATLATWNLDGSAAELIELATASTLGVQAAEREAVEWTGKQPEVRAARGPEIVALIAQLVSPPVLERVLFPHLCQLAIPVDRKTTKSEDKAAVVDSYGRGDVSVRLDSLLRAFFVDGLRAIMKSDANGANDANDANGTSRLGHLLRLMNRALVDGSAATPHAHLLHTHAFAFITHCLSLDNGTHVLEDPSALGAMNVLIPVTVAYVLDGSRHSVALSEAFSLLVSLVAFHGAFSALRREAFDPQPLLQRVLGLVLNGARSGDGARLASIALRLAAALVRDWPGLVVTDDQVRALIASVQLHLATPLQTQSVLQSAAQQHPLQHVFGLVRALVSRGVVLLEVFELMETARHVMLSTHDQGTRRHCRELLVHFLLNCPMATRQLHDQLDFLLANVRSEFVPGRLAAVETLAALLPRLPSAVIDEIAEATLLALAAQLANDCRATGNGDVQDALLRTVVLLFARLPMGKRLDNLHSLLSRWVTQGGKLTVQLVAWKIVLALLTSPASSSAIPVIQPLLSRAVELSASSTVPDELACVVLSVLGEGLRVGIVDGGVVGELVQLAADARFFSVDSSPPVRHSVALLWNALFSSPIVPTVHQ